MRIAKLALTVTLLLFVGATIGMLVAQEVSPPIVAVQTEAEAPDVEIEAPEPGTEGPEPLTELAAEPSVDTEDEPPSAAAEATAVAKASAEPEPVVDEAPASVCILDAIYFHNTGRCRTCKKIESTARETLEATFVAEFAGGRLRWSAINMEEERHYVEKYSLVKPTLILLRTVDEQPQDWVALDEAWTLIRYEARFSTYIEESARTFLEGCP